ncbi:ubiquinone biosynthesis regulatory protein kinase UbiB [Maricurvus nonylphenolicus]|uniref:ubiquinone biosynthesis regulatory protein kinase UbiB n=1 Tax=Maricurvus nonylphenolicus TaxID=1008307 RepID=UPI0036F1E542
MAALFRFFTIFRLLLRYRLDTLLPREHLGWPLRLLLTFTALLPKPSLSRGERLRRFCEDLGPVFIKFGQLLSTRPDLVPADIVEELDHLQDNVAPFDNDHCRELIEEALGAPVEQLFASFNTEPLASASVAQVHAAELKDGREVVVKVVRPGLEKIIAKDIALMLVLARALARFSEDGRRLRPEEVVQDYRHTIFDELDLQREAANASQLRRNFANSPLLYVPEVYWDYTRRNVMVMERIYGVPVTNLEQLEAQQTNMKKLAERGVEIFFTQVFKHNFFHADMHPGNIFVSHQNPQRPQYIAVDMAIVGSLTQADQYYLARNLLAMFRRDYRLVAELHIQSGWVPENTPLNDFEAAIRTVCEPIFEKPLKDISFGQVLIKLFQTARRFDMEVQPQLILLQKTLLNIEGLGRQLYPDLDLWATAHPFLENWLKDRFHPKTLLQQLKRYGPEWMEQFPQVPQTMFNALKQVQHIGEIAPELHQAAEHFAKQRAKATRTRSLTLIAIGAAIATVASAWPQAGQHLAQLPPHTWALAGLAAGAWLLR